MTITKIAFIGQQCSGKTSAAKICMKYFDSTRVFKIADPIYDTLNALHQEKHRAFMQQFADVAKEHFGEQVLVDVFRKNVEQAVKENKNSSKSCLIACDDIRFPYELETVKEQLGFHLIGINTSREVRKKRAEAQGFEFIENHNSETLVPQLFQHCNYTIFDDGISLDQLEFHLSRILEQIGIIKSDYLKTEAEDKIRPVS
jgi:dephospho-CoA kinase